MDNRRIAERLDAFATLLELAEANPYMGRAYRRAAETDERRSEVALELGQLGDRPGLDELA